MAIIRWQQNPGGVSEFERLKQEVDRLFDGFSMGSEPFFSRVYPALNVSEDPDRLYVRAELPGVKADTLEISVVEGRLLISGERKIGVEDEKAGYHRREREAGIFRRTLTLPSQVEAGKVTASLKNGILTIIMPKAEEAKPRKITVKTD